MQKSLLFIANLSWAALTWHLTTTPNLVVAPENLLNTIIMMGGHFTFFGTQAVLLRLSNLNNTSSILISSLYGLVIELAQLSVPGRSADPMDWILDTLGAITFLAILKKLKLGNRFLKL